jgi:hypothetical protein
MSADDRKTDKFENGNFWELYKDLERQFDNFLEYVPYLEGNEGTYSFKLANLILGIGGHVDSAFKEMARYPRFCSNVECKEILALMAKSEENVKEGKAPLTVPIRLPLKAFEKEYQLTKKKVIFKRLPDRETILPFAPCNERTNVPKWWEVYNGLKHDFSANFKTANVRNTRDALAGAFLLNAIHIPSALRMYRYDIIKPQQGTKFVRPAHATFMIGDDDYKEKLIEFYEKFKHFIGMLETSLFIFSYQAQDD